MNDDEKGPMPSLTLIFTTDDGQNADWHRLLDLADYAIDAIQAADPRFHILKSFTFYAGTGPESQHKLQKKLDRQQAVVEAAQRFMDAADLRMQDGEMYFDAYHDARHDLYQALAALTQEEP
jgi:hypothetical protein